MTPSQLYEQHCQQHGLVADSRQKSALAHFDRLHAALIESRKPRTGWRRLFKRKPAPVRGIYLWGDVGRGKTMLMDIFHESLPGERKMRQHYHHFMRLVHRDLKGLRSIEKPLTIVAGRVAREADVLCLDEFHVNDITDAMLLTGLLEALADYGVCVVATSNREPDELYKNGLQRERFLPAIELIKKSNRVIHLDHKHDYRLAALRKEGTFHCPLNSETAAHMEHAFATLTNHAPLVKHAIKVNDRNMSILGRAGGVAWFDFTALCRSSRSQIDYIEIARQFHSVFISEIPAMTKEHDDAARRFLTLLDVLYHHKVKLIASADTTIDKLYSGQKLAFEFQRATSRLHEMQSEKYLRQSHQG